MDMWELLVEHMKSGRVRFGHLFRRCTAEPLSNSLVSEQPRRRSVTVHCVQGSCFIDSESPVPLRQQ